MANLNGIQIPILVHMSNLELDNDKDSELKTDTIEIALFFISYISHNIIQHNASLQTH